jgi:hypothetical protein
LQGVRDTLHKVGLFDGCHMVGLTGSSNAPMQNATPRSDRALVESSNLQQ